MSRISTQRYTGDKAGAESVKAQVHSTGQGIREGGKGGVPGIRNTRRLHRWSTHWIRGALHIDA